MITQVMRVFIVKKWYSPHRSHAYQNLARITGSHVKVTYGVLLYNLLWVLPLTVLSVYKTEIEVLISILAILPALIIAYKYGPLLSSS
jgi:Fuc2NAc and GlcNAc transferase